MNCTNPVTIISENPKRVKRYGCGQCINCKTKRAKEWTNRLMDEATEYDDISIIVLTYDNEHIHWGEKTKHGRYGTLWHRDIQNYLKTIRKTIERETKKGNLTRQETELKYFIAGEYGELKKRPHYHLVLFGLNGLKHKKHKEIVEKYWEHGQVMHDNKNRELSAEGFAYVAQYVQKKIYDEKHGKYYTDRGIVAPYNISSKGIGKKKAIKNRKKFEKQNYKYADNENHITRVPRAYVKWWKSQDIEEYEKLYKNIVEKKITPEEASEKLKIMWENSTEYKLIKLNEKIKEQKNKMLEKEGIITDYKKISPEQLKYTELYKKLYTELTCMLEKDTKTRKEKITEKKIKSEESIDKYVEKMVYYYQEVREETYEVEQYELHKAQKLEKFRLEKIGMQRRGIE